MKQFLIDRPLVSIFVVLFGLLVCSMGVSLLTLTITVKLATSLTTVSFVLIIILGCLISIVPLFTYMQDHSRLERVNDNITYRIYMDEMLDDGDDDDLDGDGRGDDALRRLGVVR